MKKQIPLDDRRYKAMRELASKRGLELVALQDMSDGGAMCSLGRSDDVPHDVTTGPYALAVATVVVSGWEVRTLGPDALARLVVEKARKRLFVRGDGHDFVRPMGAVS